MPGRVARAVSRPEQHRILIVGIRDAAGQMAAVNVVDAERPGERQTGSEIGPDADFEPPPVEGPAQGEIDFEAAVENRGIGDQGLGLDADAGVREGPEGLQERDGEPAGGRAPVPLHVEVHAVGIAISGHQRVRVVVGIVDRVDRGDPVEGAEVAFERREPVVVLAEEGLGAYLHLVGHDARGLRARQHPGVDPEGELLVPGRVDELAVPARGQAHRRIPVAQETPHGEPGRECHFSSAGVRPPVVCTHATLHQPVRTGIPVHLAVSCDFDAAALLVQEGRTSPQQAVVVRDLLGAYPRLPARRPGGKQLEIRADARLLDPGLELGVGLRKGQIGSEAGQRGANRHRSAPAHRLRPRTADRVVPPPPSDREGRVIHSGEVHDVPSRVPDETEPASAPRPRLEDSLHVRHVVREVDPGLEEHVQIGTPRGHAPAGRLEPQFFGDAPGNRSVDRQARCQDADARVDPELSVPGIALDGQHRRDPPAVLGREASGLQFDPVHHVRVEHGEDAPQVERVEDRHLVEEDEVLVGGAAADVERRREVRNGSHARKHFDGPERIRFGDDGERLEGGGLDLLHGDPGRLLEAGLGAAALGLDRDARDLDGLRSHGDLDFGPLGLDGHLFPVFLEADSGHSEHVRALLEIAEGEEAELIRKGVFDPRRVGNRVDLRERAFDGTAVLGPDPAAQLVRLGECGQGCDKDDERKQDLRPRRESRAHRFHVPPVATDGLGDPGSAAPAGLVPPPNPEPCTNCATRVPGWARQLYSRRPARRSS